LKTGKQGEEKENFLVKTYVQNIVVPVKTEIPERKHSISMFRSSKTHTHVYYELDEY
jgi:hypothetical protein